MSRGFRGGVVTAACAGLILQSVALSGCVSTATRDARIGADNGSDACYAQRKALDDTRSFLAEDILAGALAGVATGLVVGVLTGNTSYAAQAIGGAVVGAVAGGFFSELVKRQGQDKAVDSALGSVKKENDNLQRTQLAMDNLLNCRRDEIKAVKADFKAKRINKTEGEARMVAIRARMDRDYEIAAEINGKVTKRGVEFNTALKDVSSTGKGKKQTDYAKETASLNVRNQGIQKSAGSMDLARKEATMDSDLGFVPFWKQVFVLG